MTPVMAAPARDPRSQYSEDTEITLGTGKMLALFFGLVVLCATFFGMGYSIGHNSAKSNAELLPSPSTSRPTRQSTSVPQATAPPVTDQTVSKPADTQQAAPDSSSTASSTTPPADHRSGAVPYAAATCCQLFCSGSSGKQAGRRASPGGVAKGTPISGVHRGCNSGQAFSRSGRSIHRRQRSGEHARPPSERWLQSNPEKVAEQETRTHAVRSRFFQCERTNQIIPAAISTTITTSSLCRYFPSSRQFSPIFIPNQARKKHHGHDPRKV